MSNYVFGCVGALNLAFLAYFRSNRESGASFKLLLLCGLFPAYNFIKMYWYLLVYSVSMLYPVRCNAAHMFCAYQSDNCSFTFDSVDCAYTCCWECWCCSSTV